MDQRTDRIMKEKLMHEKSIYSAAVPVCTKVECRQANTEYIEITKEREKEMEERGQKLKAI